MGILLKRGITGFYEKGDLLLNETDFREFVRICYLLQTVFKIKNNKEKHKFFYRKPMLFLSDGFLQVICFLLFIIRTNS